MPVLPSSAARRGFLLLALALCRLPPAYAQPDTLQFQVRPLLASSDDLGTWTAGARFNAVLRKNRVTSGTDFFAQLDAKGTALLKPSLNTEPLIANLTAGGVFRFFKPPTFVIVPGEIPDPDAPPVDPGWNYGRLDVGLAARYEVEQTFEDQNAALALVLGYVHTNRHGFWLVVPAFVLALDGVLPIRDNTRGDLGVGDDAFLRFRLDASLDLPFGQYLGPTALRPFGLQGSYTFNHEFGAAALWQAAGLNQAHYLTGALSYNLGQGMLDEVYIQVAHGRIPPEMVVLTTFKIGILLAR